MERALASRVSIRQEKTTIRQLINNAAPCTWIQIVCIVNSTTSDTMGTAFHLCGSTVGASIDPNWRATHSLAARWPPHARSRDISYLDLGSAPAPNRRDTHSTFFSLAARWPPCARPRDISYLDLGSAPAPNRRGTHSTLSSLAARWPQCARSRDIAYLDLGSAPAPNRRDTHSTLPSLAARWP